MEITSELFPAGVLLMGDLERLQQVFNNLLTNAIKYSRNRGKVHIKTVQQGDWCIAKIIDNGRGIPEAHLPHIFDIYYRTEGVKKTVIEGSGLGLHIVKKLVEAHEGHIKVASQVGIGSTFSIYLPSLKL